MLPLVLYDAMFILSYKDIPFVTIWVEYSDIHIAMKSIGAKPIKRRDGSEVCTVPTYPEKPIFPNNSEPLIRAFDSAHLSLIFPGFKSLFLRTMEALGPASANFFIGVRSADVPLPWDENFDADWKLLEKAYNTAYEWYQMTDGKWIMGDTFSYADIIIGCWLLWHKRVLKEDEWARISSWNGGKWAQVLEDVEKECKLA
ncbi:hypothetical protein DFJ58DRAFT_794445 [Suillus subalutaceus]|uniref:uncharacterized protein n=1 Tax=Suillus subalutaceus TaxID=48586 RepID=UPI001B883E56|nr:uncharacterized protein DFJ58DRAFT_794445 [Suillus subalutaceus]KAG1849932.1 hypothetical protein DFJ58DRAFT_794445 [Suillus subalutaceus]